jgi:hypothetical protein
MDDHWTVTNSSGRRVSILSDDQSARQHPAPQETATTTSVRLPPLRNLLPAPERPNYHPQFAVSPGQGPLGFDGSQPALATYASTVSAPSYYNTAPSAAAATAEAATAAETWTAEGQGRGRIFTATGVERSDRLFPCDQCEFAFTRLEHLTRHAVTHTGARSHTCPEEGCSGRYSRWDNLVQHLRIVHGIVGYTGVPAQYPRP